MFIQINMKIFKRIFTNDDQFFPKFFHFSSFENVFLEKYNLSHWPYICIIEETDWLLKNWCILLLLLSLSFLSKTENRGSDVEKSQGEGWARKAPSPKQI